MTEEELQTLATAFHEAATQDLAGAETPEQIHAATLRSHQRLHNLEKQLFEEFSVKVDCKAGCGTCCYLGKIDARAHEVFALAAWIQQNFSAEAREALLERAEAHGRAIAGLTLEQQLRTVRPCPVLIDNQCSAHPARPSICRIGHSTNVAICKRAYENPEDLEAASGYHAETKLAMTVAALGSTWAFIESGFDKTAYDLGSALAEALRSPEPLQRWMRGEPAFSDAARAKQEDMGRQDVDR